MHVSVFLDRREREADGVGNGKGTLALLDGLLERFSTSDGKEMLDVTEREVEVVRGELGGSLGGADGRFHAAGIDVGPLFHAIEVEHGAPDTVEDGGVAVVAAAVVEDVVGRDGVAAADESESLVQEFQQHVGGGGRRRGRGH